MASPNIPTNAHNTSNTPPFTASGAVVDDTERAANPTTAHSHSDNASSNDQIIEKTPNSARATKRQKINRHCGKFWLWYLAAGFIFLIILLPLLFKVILPAIVQAVVSSQNIPIEGGALIVNSPSAITLSIQSSIKTPLPAEIAPLNLFLSNGESPVFSPFLNVTFPKKRVNGKTPISVVNQTVPITNAAELTNWFSSLFTHQTAKLTVHGKTGLSLGSLKYSPRLAKTISLPGFNKLDGFGVEKLKILFPADANGKNIKGTANVPNYTVFSFGFGNLTLSLYSGELNIGYITLYDVHLAPGNNTQAFDGQIYLNTLVKNLPAVLEAQAEALGRGQIELTAVGNSTIVNGEHIKFIEDVLNKSRLVSSIGLVTLLSDLASGALGGGKTSLSDALGNIFGNSTLLDDMAKYWNTTAISSVHTKREKAVARGSMAWSLVKARIGRRVGMQ